MIKVENIHIGGFESAIRGMRNPLQSWAKSDPMRCNQFARCSEGCPLRGQNCTIIEGQYIIGPNDLALARKLYQAGTEHRKFLRFIHVSMDIVAPDYFFKEFATYRVGVTENSTSTMHTIAAREFTLDDFSLENMEYDEALEILQHNERRRKQYVESKDDDDWRALIQGLPMSYNYRRTVDMNYENVVTMIRQRKNHKLSEWRELVEVFETFPYIKQICE